eukprot:CAMPEP_0201984640 /NCGR_PEP_ID=MMETSP0904-20121228/84140_1 /ASSEMBLY_ACC=CAM_ASM_000553 /TAXON_ID=420261 /ORGANISM="Thalassiosira antarctica, Strain CCMP982" /LENGTH=332 /DNA_ID=CAMNT_0048538075 /DNA_START=12 /DNA_END=1007 /DNA_ORIENTATION=+
MADNDCWGAFGSDSDSDDENAKDSDGQSNPFEPAADATSLVITQHFVSLAKSRGVLPKERVVGIGSCHDGMENFQEMMMERVAGRGMKVVLEGWSMLRDFQCDAAIVLTNNTTTTGRGETHPSSRMKRALLPGGFLWLMISLEQEECGIDTTGDGFRKRLEDYSEAIWDVDSASVVYSSSDFQVISMQKRSCVINAWSLPWMSKRNKIQSQLSTLNENEDFPISANDTYLQYERKVASAVTISPSLAERTRKQKDTSEFATVLTDANTKRATKILQKHGLVVIKGLLPPAQTIPWGEAVLSDFESAVARLKCHPKRPVDLLNPHTGDTIGGD